MSLVSERSQLDVNQTRSSRHSRRVGRMLREPLVHFLIAGSRLLGLSTFFGRSAAFRDQKFRIDITAAKIGRLRDTWTAQSGRPPDAKQMRDLIDDYVREEVFYREAIASGLDKDDTIIR